MDEKNERIQELERQLEGLQQEVDTLKRGTPRSRYGTGPDQPGPGGFRYHQHPAPPPKVRLGRIALIVVGCLAALAAVVAVLIFLITTLMNTMDKETTAMAEELLQAVVEQDADRAYALMYPGAVERETFDQGFAEMCETWRTAGGSDTFELKRTSLSINSSNGVTQYESGYKVTSGGARFSFTLTRVEQGDSTGMVGAQISRSSS